jgi:hypothetical protein
MSDHGPTPTHWIDGVVRDDAPIPVTPWQQVIAVVLLLWVFDFALALRPPPPEAAHDANSKQLRATLEHAAAEAEAGHRSILLIGDSVLAGDVLARDRPHDWDSQRVIDHMRRELSSESDARIEQVALDGLLPVDALHLVTELDRLDPRGEVEVVLELNLRFFSAQYRDQGDCTRPAICAVGAAPRHEYLLVSAWDDVATTAIRIRDRMLDWTPVHRRRARVETRALDRVPGLAVSRDQDAAPEQGDAEAIARVLEHYRSSSIDPDEADEHAQLEALITLLDSAAAHDRKLTLFLTPLADSFARRSFDAGGLGRRHSALARLVNDHEDPDLALIDLDHPLFVDAHFVDHVHLGVEGSRLLALNLLHELNLPLAKRPFEQQMVHPEGHDRTLVHRIGMGYAEGGAWTAKLEKPEGVAVSRDGTRIVVADTENHVLRELRGNMQFVETIAGKAEEPGNADGFARQARLEQPRNPELVGSAVWFIDGEQRRALRVLDHRLVRTVNPSGSTCRGYRSIRAREHAVWALCGNGRMVRIDIARNHAEQVFAGAPAQPVAFDLTHDTLYLADSDGRLWSVPFVEHADGTVELGEWNNFFANSGTELLPHGHQVVYPYHYDDLRLAKVVDLRFVERYGGLLVADEFPLITKSKRLQKELTERVHLRYFDLDAERILPWIKAIPHGEAYALANEGVDLIASYYHLGSMAIAQDDASLVWVERRRSRLFRIADGLLGVAKTGNHHTRKIAIPMLQTISGVSQGIETQLRPDRFLDRRHEPLARKGPYVAVLFGSSLSSMSDRLSNYSLGRRLELELQRELGYRDGVRIDLFQTSNAATSFAKSIDNFANWMKASVPPDVVFLEAHDFGGGKWYMRDSKTRAEVVGKFAELRQLADRYDTLIVFYDLSSIEANRRDSMRATDQETREVLELAERLGFVVLDPGDRLFRELLRHSPWGNQPFDDNQHHGAPWAVDMTARTLAVMLYPRLREFLRDRVPARLRERAPGSFADGRQLDPLRLALDEVRLDRQKLARIEPGYLQTELVGNQLRVYVDLAGFRTVATNADLDALAVAVIDRVLREDIYADFAETLRLQMVEFANYDEYGNGVLESAESKWQRELDREGLQRFLLEHRPR